MSATSAAAPARYRLHHLVADRRRNVKVIDGSSDARCRSTAEFTLQWHHLHLIC